MASFEDAKQCPKCKQPGEEVGTRPAPKGATKGSKLVTIKCKNERCVWFDTIWYVQLNPDGSVPEPKDHRGEPKLYEGFEGHDELARQISDALEAERILSQQHGEIRNPYSR